MNRTPDRASKLRDRYARLVLERFHAMLANPEFSKVQKKWLRHLGLRQPFPTIDKWAEREYDWRENDPHSRDELTRDVTALSASFALAPWHVLWALFVRGYDPLESVGSMFPLDVWHPRSHILVTAPQPGLVDKLQQLAAGTGMIIVLQPSADIPEPREDGGRPARFRLEVDLPLELPPDLAVLEIRHALRTGRDIIRGTGLQLPLRVRGGTSDSRIYAGLIAYPGDSTMLKYLKAAFDIRGMELHIDTSREVPNRDRRHGWVPLADVRLEVIFAPEVGAETLVRYVKGAIRNARLALKDLGLDLGQRLRPSPLVGLSRELRVDGGRLPPKGLGDIVEEQLDAFPRAKGKRTPEAEKAIGRVKSQRSKIKRRLTKKALLN